MPQEINFESIPGPNHTFSGLALDNKAAANNKGATSSPRAAALQALDKIELLLRMGIAEAFLPPQERPALWSLRLLGFSGGDCDVLDSAFKNAPELAYACYSSSAMWVANAATVSPSADTADHKVHLTPANLCSAFHRSIEAEQTERTLRRIFLDQNIFSIHSPLPSVSMFSDEGAANHTRLSSTYNSAGIEIFVYGRDVNESLYRRLPGRQTCLASEAIARLHNLDDERCIFLKQNPAAIDAGVFHNDVIAVGNLDTLVFHELAFDNSVNATDLISRVASNINVKNLDIIEIKAAELSLDEAVKTYLFNSQIVLRPDGKMQLIAPAEVSASAAAQRCVQKIISETKNIADVSYVDLTESMKNGGGPACLRLRVSLTESEINSVNAPFILNVPMLTQLRNWVIKHYRETLTLNDLRDPELIKETRVALDELTRLLHCPNLYPFQL